MFCWTIALFILHHYVLMDLCGEKINRGELPDSRESTHMCTQKHTDYVLALYINRVGGWVGFTCWTSHLCSVEMGMGHCCWSHSWHRHSEKTKWMYLLIITTSRQKNKRRRGREEDYVAKYWPNHSLFGHLEYTRCECFFQNISLQV